MKKIIILLFVISLTILTIMIIDNPLTGNVILDQYTYTKAICNSTKFCQDYIITCQGRSIVNTEPILGATIQHQKNWIDPRNSDENLC